MIQYYAMSMHACMRWLHASPNAPAVDIYANGNLLLQNFVFGQLTDYACVRPGVYQLTVYPAGTTTGALIDATVTVTMRMNATLALTGLVENIGLLVIPEPPVFLTYASSLLRTVQLSPDAPALDFAANGSVLFSNMTYGITTDYVAINPGTSAFSLRASETGETLAAAPDNNIGPGRANTAFAIGLAAGTPPMQLLVAVDANSFKR